MMEGNWAMQIESGSKQILATAIWTLVTLDFKYQIDTFQAHSIYALWTFSNMNKRKCREICHLFSFRCDLNLWFGFFFTADLFFIVSNFGSVTERKYLVTIDLVRLQVALRKITHQPNYWCSTIFILFFSIRKYLPFCHWNYKCKDNFYTKFNEILFIYNIFFFLIKCKLISF